jgi:hypothetical protein
MPLHQGSEGGFRILFGEVLQKLRVIHISDAFTVYPRRAVFGDNYFWRNRITVRRSPALP